MENQHLEDIKTIFKTTLNRYDAHHQCREILKKLAGSKDFLNEIIKNNLSNPDFLNKKRHYSTLAMSIFDSPEFSFVMNIFPPLPDRRTGISFQSIHHHGNLMLSTISAFGPGYESIVFKKDYHIKKEDCTVNIQIDKIYNNQIGNVEFIDSQQPHVVFYPTDFSATYALWSDSKKTNKEVFKKFNFLKNMKKPLVKIVHALGIGHILGLNKVEYFDFYPEDGKIKALKERLVYDQSGDNENFLQNIFSFIQQTGFRDKEFLHHLMSNESFSVNAKKYVKMLLDGEQIKDSFFSGHLNIPFVNLNKQEILVSVGD